VLEDKLTNLNTGLPLQLRATLFHTSGCAVGADSGHPVTGALHLALVVQSWTYPPGNVSHWCIDSWHISAGHTVNLQLLSYLQLEEDSYNAVSNVGHFAQVTSSERRRHGNLGKKDTHESHVARFTQRCVFHVDLCRFGQNSGPNIPTMSAVVYLAQ